MRRVHLWSGVMVLLAVVVGCQPDAIHSDPFFAPPAPPSAGPSRATPSPALAPASPASAPSSAAEATGSAQESAPAEVAARLLDEPTRRVVKFTNGFTLLLQQNKTAPVVATRLYVKAGSTTEQQFTGAGLSHIVEHLVAAASSGKRQEAENTLLLLQIGNDSNAYTDADHTCYFITTASDKWPIALDLLVDFTTNTNFTREVFEREFKVVQREIEMDEAETDRVFYAQTRANRYLESPARFPVVGHKAAFQRITFEDCKAYYQAMYVPDNMIISIAGDVDLDAAEKQVLGRIREIRQRAAPAINRPAEPPVTGPRRAVARADVAQASISWAFPTTDIYGPDVYATNLLAAIVGGSDSSPLVRTLRDEQALVAEIHCANPTPRYAPGEIEVTATLAPEKIPAAQEALLAILEDVAANGVAEAALQRAKTQYAAGLVFDNQTAEQQAQRNALDFLIAGNVDFTRAFAGHIQAVTRQQVQEAARKYLVPDHLLTTVLLPKEAKDPFALKAAAPQTPFDQVLVKKVVLKNGLTLLISRNPTGPLACFNLYTLGGLLAEDDANNGIGAIMMGMMTRQTTTRTHGEIADFLDATGTSLVGTSGNNVFQLSMATLSEHAPEAFALFADVALHPRFPAADLEVVKHSPVANVVTAGDAWSDAAYKEARDAMFASSPYKRVAQGDPAIIGRLTPEAVAAHYQAHFLNPGHTVIAISGDIDPDAAVKWAQPFEALPPRNPTLNIASLTDEPRRVVKPSDKQSATVIVAYPGAAVGSPDRPTLTLLKTYLGGYAAPGGSPLHEALRGRGLVYTVRSTNFTGLAGGMFFITALGEPQNAGPIAATITGLIETIKRGNVPDALFAAAKDQLIMGEKMSHLTVADMSAQQALNEALGLGWDEDQRLPGRINGITKDEFVRVANKYLAAPTVVILTPEARERGNG